MTSTPARCRAAHRDDVSVCDGVAEAVLVVDAVGGSVTGCVHHGAVLLASLDSGRVYPGPDRVPGAAIDAYTRAAALAPFYFRKDSVA